MKLVELIKPDFIFEDEKGFLAQLIHEPFSQINVVYTKNGQQEVTGITTEQQKKFSLLF